MTGTVLVETERLLLRLPGHEDVPEIANFFRKNHDHLQAWSPTFGPELTSARYWERQVRERWAEWQAGLAARTFLHVREDPARIVGNLSLVQIERGPSQSCILGYALAATAQGQGYMVEAVRAAVDFAFGRLRLHRVMANYMPHNRRSAAVLRRAGFVVEGYGRDYLLINGQWEGHVLTAITNPDWSL